MSGGSLPAGTIPENNAKMNGMDYSSVVDRFLKRKGYRALNLKAILFDMDGVLFDSMKGHTASWCKAISYLGIPCEQDEFYKYEGATGKWTINHIFKRAYGRQATDREMEEIYTEKTRLFNQLPEANTMPGASELLEKVVKEGLIPILVTGSGQRSLITRLDKEFPGVFTQEHMVTALDVKQGKPHPEPYLRGLDKAGVHPDEAMVVENAPLGVKAAVAAGIFTVAVNTGPIPEKELKKAGANLVFPDMTAFAGPAFDELLKAMRNSSH